jgi:chaperone modulatory protein CbpM
MEEQEKSVVSGVVIEELETFTLRQFCQVCAIQEDHIAEFVVEGILEPEGRDRHSWRFSQSSLRWALKARRLQRDLDINLAGVSVILGLMEELEALRAAQLSRHG